jgi:serine/threonine protein kinase
MAPEQVKGKRGDERTDIYSLGAMLYEMVVGVPPFQCENDNPLVIMNARVDGDPIAPRTRNPKVSPQIEEIILHAMERDPRKRYQTAAAMKSELDNPAAVQLTARFARLQESTPWKRGWKKALWLTLGISIPLIIFGIVIWLIIHRGPAH